MRQKFVKASKEEDMNRLARWEDWLPEKRDAKPQESQIACPQCGRLCNNLAELGAHARTKHGTPSKYKYWVDASNECVACRMKFCSRVVALQHVQKSKRCFEAIQEMWQHRPLPDSEVHELSVASLAETKALAARGYRANKVTAPQVTLLGPICKIAYSHRICPMYRLQTGNCAA